jgi:hypothetical protein
MYFQNNKLPGIAGVRIFRRREDNLSPMGNINRFDLNRIIREYRAPFFFETGTFRGDGVAYALQSSFKKIISVEIIPEIADQAKQRFNAEPGVEIIEGESTSVLQQKLPELSENCIFWLDAHFPGADAGMTEYDAANDEAVRLPLANELETIYKLRAGFKDVLILDDLRIYEDGPYEKGNVPADALPKSNRDIGFVYDYFSKSHRVMKSYLDEGYLLLFPKQVYRRKHFSFSGFLKRKPLEDDFYLTESKK